MDINLRDEALKLILVSLSSILLTVGGVYFTVIKDIAQIKTSQAYTERFIKEKLPEYDKSITELTSDQNTLKIDYSILQVTQDNMKMDIALLREDKRRYENSFKR